MNQHPWFLVIAIFAGQALIIWGQAWRDPKLLDALKKTPAKRLKR